MQNLYGLRTIFGLFLLIGGSLLLSNCNVKTDNGERQEVGIALDSLVRRVAIPSVPMNQVFNAYVILPERYFTDSVPQFFPVVYLLHGYTGDHSNWYTNVNRLSALASELELILVTPEGGRSSWYLDSPLDSASLFYTYISQEVPSYVRENFRIREGAENQAITGLSMGGHGALYIAMKNTAWFGAAGSMSGVVDIARHPEDWELASHLGPFEADSLIWQENAVLNLLRQRTNYPALIIDCGTEDGLLAENRDLHQRLLDFNVPHTYIERPGGHNWPYWADAVEWQLRFFKQHFDSL